MNNAQFRRLLVGKPSSPPQATSAPQDESLTVPESRTPALGSRLRSSIPMTPRSVAGYTKSHAASEFAKQVSDAMGPPAAKRFKSSAAPKGTKLAVGYVDRVAIRREEGGKEDKAAVGEDTQARISALEQMVKSGQMDSESFENLKRQILGEEVKAKKTTGLDWEMFRKAREGEDVGGTIDTDLQAKADESVAEQTPKANIDEELESALGDEQMLSSLDGVQKKDAPKKKGVLAQALPKPTRDEILRQFKNNRGRVTNHGSVDDSSQTLSSRFKKWEAPVPTQGSNKKRWIEIDEKSGRRREVLMTTDKEGNPKRKVRWLNMEPTTNKSERKGSETSVTGKRKKKLEDHPQVLGMEVPAEIAARQKAPSKGRANLEEEDDDIFAGAGADYNPLEDASEGSDSTSSSEKEGPSQNSNQTDSIKDANKTPSKLRNYFSTSSKDDDETSKGHALVKDQTLMAAIKRAAAIGKDEMRKEHESATTDVEAARRKEFLQNIQDRERQDAEDLDMGFGESRYGDDDDEDSGIVLEDGEQGKKMEKMRKRGPKKKKGDKENISDVMKVLSGRKTGKD